MKPRELQEIYEDACRTASNRPAPEPAQLVVWKQMFGMLDAKDLRGGLALWWRTNVFVPMPAELKPFVEQARRAQAAQNREEEYSEWECSNCLTRYSSFRKGFTPSRSCQGVIGYGPDMGKTCGSITYRQIKIGGFAA